MATHNFGHIGYVFVANIYPQLLLTKQHQNDDFCHVYASHYIKMCLIPAGHESKRQGWGSSGSHTYNPPRSPFSVSDGLKHRKALSEPGVPLCLATRSNSSRCESRPGVTKRGPREGVITKACAGRMRGKEGGSSYVVVGLPVQRFWLST